MATAMKKRSVVMSPLIFLKRNIKRYGWGGAASPSRRKKPPQKTNGPLITGTLPNSELARDAAELRNDIHYKTFMVGGLDGWYLEFGCFEGYSFSRAYRSAKLIVDEFLNDKWRAGDDPRLQKGATTEYWQTIWNNMRFVAFDSFEGIPTTDSKIDNYYRVFSAGSYACTEADFLRNLELSGADLSKIVTVPGFFDKTLNSATAGKIGLKRIAVAHIDSDLYESAKLALDFCTPYFRDGSVVIFDEWFQFRGNPFLGEQRAFSEWLAANPDWIATDYTTQGPWSKAFILSKHPGV